MVNKSVWTRSNLVSRSGVPKSVRSSFQKMIFMLQ